MGIKHFNIVMDKSVYYTGGPVSGRVIITVNKPVFLQDITLKVKGKAVVAFSKLRRSSFPREEQRVERRRYHAKENYFNLIIHILGPTGMLAGEKDCYFSFNLPPNVPSTFIGPHGSIRYTIKATAVKKGGDLLKMKKDSKIEFNVVAQTDLNYIPMAKEAKMKIFEKEFYTLLWKNGKFVMIVTVPFCGFVSGQTMPVKIEANNMSNVTVDNFVIKLIEEIIWLTGESYRIQTKTESEIVRAKVEGVKPHSTYYHEYEVVIPSIPHGNIDACNYIKSRIFLEVEGEVEGIHINPRVVIEPIFLGTIPLQTSRAPSCPYPQRPSSVGSLGPPYPTFESAPPPPGPHEDASHRIDNVYPPSFGSAPNLYPSSSFREPPPPYSVLPSAPPSTFSDSNPSMETNLPYKSDR